MEAVRIFLIPPFAENQKNAGILVDVVQSSATRQGHLYLLFDCSKL